VEEEEGGVPEAEEGEMTKEQAEEGAEQVAKEEAEQLKRLQARKEALKQLPVLLGKKTKTKMKKEEEQEEGTAKHLAVNTTCYLVMKGDSKPKYQI
jgi:hypothetical protein